MRKHWRRLFDKLAQFITDVLYDRKITVVAKILGSLLLQLSFVFSLIVKTRV